MSGMRGKRAIEFSIRPRIPRSPGSFCRSRPRGKRHTFPRGRNDLRSDDDDGRHRAVVLVDFHVGGRGGEQLAPYRRREDRASSRDSRMGLRPQVRAIRILVPDEPLPNCRRRHGLDAGYRIVAYPVRQCPQWVESGRSASQFDLPSVFTSFSLNSGPSRLSYVSCTSGASSRYL